MYLPCQSPDPSADLISSATCEPRTLLALTLSPLLADTTQPSRTNTSPMPGVHPSPFRRVYPRSHSRLRVPKWQYFFARPQNRSAPSSSPSFPSPPSSARFSSSPFSSPFPCPCPCRWFSSPHYTPIALGRDPKSHLQPLS